MINIKRIAYFLIIFFFFLIISCRGKEVGKSNSDLRMIENGLTITATLNGQNSNYNLLDRMNYYGVPGVSLAVLNNDTIQFVKGYGYSSKENKDTVNSNTIFQAASVSKPITSLAIMKMVESNLISLDKDVNQYLKGWQIDYSDYSSTTFVTLRHLLSHRSGLTRGSVAYYNIGEELPATEIEMLNATPPAKLERIKLKFEPGTDWSYSGGGYTVIQKLIEDVLGMSYEKAMDSIIFEPLKMEESFFDPTFTDKTQNVAIGYNYDGSQVEGGWMILTELAAGGLWTTPSDMLKFIHTINNSLMGKPGSFLKKESAEEMLNLGLFVDDKDSPTVFSFRGTNKGYRCEFIGFVEAGQSHGAIVMTNSYNSRYLNQEILRSISTHYGWRYPFAPKTENFTEINLTSDLMDKLKGKYISDDGKYNITIHSIENRLIVTREWNNRSVSIIPISNNIFIDPSTTEDFKFSIDQDGNYDKFIIDNRFPYERIK